MSHRNFYGIFFHPFCDKNTNVKLKFYQYLYHKKVFLMSRLFFKSSKCRKSIGVLMLMVLKTSVCDVGSMEVGSLREWPGVNGTMMWGTGFQEESRFIVPGSFSQLKVGINTGHLTIGKSADEFFHIQATGEEAALSKLLFTFDANGLVLDDKNEAPKMETNIFGSSVSLGDDMVMSLGNISFGGNVCIGNVSYGSSIYKVNGRTVLNHVGFAMKSNSDAKRKGYLSQSVMHSFGDQESTYGQLHCEGNKLKDLKMGPQGRIWSGTILEGKVEQAGKFYGAGTTFKEGIPDKLDLESLKSSTTGAVSTVTVEKVEPKPTEITLLVPFVVDSSTFSFVFSGKGNSKTDLTNLNLKSFKGNFSDNGSFNAKSLTSTDMNVLANDYSKVSCSGNWSALTANYADNSELKFAHESTNANLSTLNLSGKDYAKMELKANGAICTHSFTLKLVDTSKLTIDKLQTTIQSATLDLADYASLDYTGSFDKVTAQAKDSSKIHIHGSDWASKKVEKSHLRQSDLISTFGLTKYAQVTTSDWNNKLIVLAGDTSKFTYTSNQLTESTQIKTNNYSKVSFNTQVRRAKINAVDSSEVSVNAVLDVLEDTKEDYAKIKVAKRPTSTFHL